LDAETLPVRIDNDFATQGPGDLRSVIRTPRIQYYDLIGEPYRAQASLDICGLIFGDDCDAQAAQ
jgi:hypothetical protein